MKSLREKNRSAYVLSEMPVCESIECMTKKKIKKGTNEAGGGGQVSNRISCFQHL